MGASGVDINLSKAAYDKFPFSAECKNQEVNKTFLNMWNQATNNSDCGDALLVLSANDSPVLAVMTLDYLMEILTGNAFRTAYNMP